ncbi:MAG: MBL fold metallo-hydrolase [Candidatus Freyarchaeota archaeon]|nr:MBL fold metallo-hydrolase [Candidatus Jordarchaeia archaeon]
MLDTGTGMFHDLKERLEKDGLSVKNVARVVLIHVHVDHGGGLAKIVEESSSKVLVPHEEADSVERGGALTLADMFAASFTPTKVNALLRGDIVFTGGSFGRVDLSTGNPRQLVSSLRGLSKLEVTYLFRGTST